MAHVVGSKRQAVAGRRLRHAACLGLLDDFRVLGGLTDAQAHETHWALRRAMARKLDDLIAGIARVHSEGNAREALRRLRATLLDPAEGAYRRARHVVAGSVAASFLGQPAFDAEALGRVTGTLEAAGLDPVGALARSAAGIVVDDAADDDDGG